MFKPLGIVISVDTGVIFPGDSFYLGSLVGATVIVVGCCWLALSEQLWLEISNQNSTSKLDYRRKETLRKILEDNESAEYMQNLGFHGRSDQESFKACVPLVTHKDLEPFMQRIIDDGTELSQHISTAGMEAR
ncbi:hypothetical protein K1719_019439 [Acacia pycnantha]|nr:hypothetical protein K1719_019439 [Acacia pycnantha]